MNNDIAIKTDFTADSDVMLVLFGGIAGNVGIPPFEFFNLPTTITTKKIFVRDLRQAWYHDSLPGTGNGVNEIAAHLRQLIQSQSPRHLVVCGNSMGGYAAILFGALLPARTILAFSPQTFIGRWRRLFVYDRRWYQQISHVYRSPYKHSPYFNLRRTFKQYRQPQTRLHIHYSIRNRLDRTHAHHLRTFTTLHPYHIDGHRLVRHLRDNGQLKHILLEVLTQ